MKILISIANHAYSFIIQGQALAKGFTKLGIDNQVAYIDPIEDLAKTLTKFNPDIIIAVGNWPDYVSLVDVPYNMGYKHIIPWIVSDDHRISKFVKEYNQYGLFATPSMHCKENFLRSGILEKTITVIAGAVDEDIWYQPLKEETENFLNLVSTPNPNTVSNNTFDLRLIKQQNIPIIYTTGGNATKKGALEVIAALGKLDKSIPWLYLIKTWPGTDAFEHSIIELSLAEKLGIRQKIKYISGEFSQSFMRNLVGLCDIYAAPSRSEGFGLPLVEAQMCGKPIITTNATATRETIINTKTGFLCNIDNSDPLLPKADIDNLSFYLEKLIINKNLRDEMGQNAIAHVRSKYSTEHIATLFLELIKNKFGI